MALNSDKFKDLCRSIKSCVISRKEKSTIELLRRDYRDIEGEDIPYLEFGFNSVRSLLQSIPEYVKLENINGTDYVFQVDNERTRLISKFVAGQKTSSKFNNRKYRGGRQNISYNHPPRPSPLNHLYRTRLGPDDLTFIVNQVSRCPQGLTRSQLLDCLHQWNRYLQISDQVLEHQLRQISHKIRLKDNLILPWKEENQTKAQPVTLLVPHQVTRNCATRSNSCSSEKKNIMPAECISSDDPEEVEEMFVNGREENNNAYPKTSGRHEEESNRLLVSDRVKLRVEKLVEEHNDGIWCAELPKLYEAKYNIGLDYTELGFGSVVEFVDHLQDYVLKQPKPRGDFKVYLKKHYHNNNSGHAQKQTIASMYNVYDPSYENKQAVPKTLTLEEKKRLIPDDVLSFDETVGQESVFDLNDGDDVIVCEVFDPSFFWIKKVEQIIPLKKLMEQLGDFYKEKYKSYLIPPIILQNGLNVACKYSNIWHRAVVLSVRADGLVNILFYDYGTINLRDANELCFLHRKFSTLPAIAIPCGLYNLMPAFGNRWQRHVVLEFTDMCLDKPSRIEIKSVDKETNSAMIHLYTDRMYIHQKMIEKRLAVEGDVITKVDLENFEQYEEHCLKARHLAGPIITALVHNRPQSYAENNLLISPQSLVECFPVKTPTKLMTDEVQPVKKTICSETTVDDIIYEYLKLIFEQNAMILDRLKILNKKEDTGVTRLLIDHMKCTYAKNMKFIQLHSTWNSNVFKSENEVNGDAQHVDEPNVNDNYISNNPFKNPEINGNVVSSNDTISRAQVFFNTIENEVNNGIWKEEQKNGFREFNGTHYECDRKQSKVEDDNKVKQIVKKKTTPKKERNNIVQDQNAVIKVALDTVIDGNVHALVFDNECWLITEEFCYAFLNLTLGAFNIMMQEKQSKIDRRVIVQADYPTIFKELTRNNVIEHLNNTKTLDVISTKSAMIVLVKFGTINLKGLKMDDLMSKAVINKNEKAPHLDQFQEMVLKDFMAITKAYINFTKGRAVSEINLSL